MGLLMAQYNSAADDAFETLQRASQNSNRQPRDIAEDLISPGRLPLTARTQGRDRGRSVRHEADLVMRSPRREAVDDLAGTTHRTLGLVGYAKVGRPFWPGQGSRP